MCPAGGVMAILLAANFANERHDASDRDQQDTNLYYWIFQNHIEHFALLCIVLELLTSVNSTKTAHCCDTFVFQTPSE